MKKKIRVIKSNGILQVGEEFTWQSSEKMLDEYMKEGIVEITGEELELKDMEGGEISSPFTDRGSVVKSEYGHLLNKFIEEGKSQTVRVRRSKAIHNEPKYGECPEIILPHEGRLISSFASEVSNALKGKNKLFFRVDAKDTVEVGMINLHKTKKDFYYGFLSISPTRFITLAENYITPIIRRWDSYNKEWVFAKKSMTSDLANTLLSSSILQQALPQIRRVFTIPIPIMYNNELTFPKKGYDERFESWLPYDAPEISKPDMNLNEAKEIIEEIFKEFCFEEDKNHNKVNAIAALLTPFLKGLFSSFNVRIPVFFYIANRERCGKDYCAGITGIVYEGQATEEPPINSSENLKINNSSEELRKKFLSTFLNGKKRLHFANNKGFIDNVTFEALATSSHFSDRILGRNESFTFDNELDLSLSGNIGVSYTPDFANRCRFIKLFLDIENANERKFKRPNLHKWVKENRELILSALFSLVRNWSEKGCPDGKIPFTSFPEWANICGGIIECAGYTNPCIVDKDALVGGDVETTDMKRLFELCYEKYPDKIISKEEVRTLIINSFEELFEEYDLTKPSDKLKFGKKLNKWVNRIESGIRMQVDVKDRASEKQKLKFSKVTQTELSDNIKEKEK